MDFKGFPCQFHGVDVCLHCFKGRGILEHLKNWCIQLLFLNLKSDQIEMHTISINVFYERIKILLFPRQPTALGDLQWPWTQHKSWCSIKFLFNAYFLLQNHIFGPRTHILGHFEICWGIFPFALVNTNTKTYWHYKESTSGCKTSKITSAQ